MNTKEPIPIESEGRLKIVARAGLDWVVLRRRALMDQREEKKLGNRLTAPIGWSQVLIIFSDHLGVMMDPVFVDNVLYLLLENRRMESIGRRTGP